MTLKRGANVVLDTTETLVNNLSTVMTKTIHSVSSNSENIVNTIGNTMNQLGKDVQVVSNLFAVGLGTPIKDIANDFGKIVKKIPIVGGPSAYLVTTAGKGIYYVVLTLGDVVGLVGKHTGKLGKTATNVAVFVLVQGTGISNNVITDANKLVNKVLSRAKLTFSINSSKRRSRKSRGRRRRNRGGRRRSRKSIRSRRRRN
tara:strand:- start:3767 stop:4369 length:603 start_codon:yes stop_codon:yes gene_type:complete